MDCYQVIIRPVTWTEAQNYCVSQGTALASINSLYDQAFLDTILDNDIQAWIGLADLKVNIME